MERALCPVLVGRSDELSRLEDALLAAHRGDGGLVLLAGDAGMGKTRLSTEVASRARRLNMKVLLGGCSEAELALPYLPFLEAIGNHLAGADLAAVRAGLDPMLLAELGNLFPQLGASATHVNAGDAAQGKLRLYEALLALLQLAAAGDGALVVVEDLHWADSSTRELLDYMTRRLRTARILVLGTYRRDEMHRKHPLLPLIQGWRRGGGAEVIELEPLAPDRVAEMVTAIFDLADGVRDDTRDFLFQRTEGNPFVLEEMLKAAVDRGDIFRGDDGWTRKALTDFRLPETVRDTILLRLDRFDDAQLDVLRAASVLGATFDYQTLVEVAGSEGSVVQATVEVAVHQQLITDAAGERGRYRFRHALTREAVYDDMIQPRREHLHGCAADVLAARPGTPPIELCGHLLAAGRRSEAVPIALAAAADAERTYAFAAAAALYERILPEPADAYDRPAVLCRCGVAHRLAANPARSREYLREGMRLLEARGDERVAAGYRLEYGRALWESGQQAQAAVEYEAARAVLERHPPSGELAMAYVRLAGERTFQFDGAAADRLADRAIEIAEAVGADMTRIWAGVFKGGALGLLGRPDEGIELLDRAYDEALALGLVETADNALFNGCVLRQGNFRGSEIPGRLRLLETRALVAPSFQISFEAMAGLNAFSTGGFADGLAAQDRVIAAARSADLATHLRRGLIWRAMNLVELGRTDEAEASLAEAGEPDQDQERLAALQVRMRLAIARRALAGAPGLIEIADVASREWSSGPRAIPLMAAAWLARSAGDAERAGELAAAIEALGLEADHPMLAAARAIGNQVAGRHREAIEHARRAIPFWVERGYWKMAASSRLLLAEALAAAGETGAATAELDRLAAEAAERGAVLIGAEILDLAGRLGVELAAVPASSTPSPHQAPGPTGERFVTVLFADVRGYTALTNSLPPAQMTERLAAFQRWAAAEVEKHHGVVDKFAGDAVMATFNVSGAHVDHALHAVQAAIAIRDKAAASGLEVGIGIATGPAVVGALAPGANLSVVGATTNLASRLQSRAERSQILLAEETHRRVASWLATRGLVAAAETLEVKGFAEPVAAHRVPAEPVVAGSGAD